MKCPYCKGTGVALNMTDLMEWEPEPCPDCRGEGSLPTTRWLKLRLMDLWNWWRKQMGETPL